MARLVMGISSMVAVLVTGGAAWASPPEPWERPSADGERLGVVVAESEEVASGVEEALAPTLEEVEATVVREMPVASRADEAMVKRLEAMREEGAETYFFEGMKPARDHLRQALEGMLETTRPWMGDQRASKAVFETGIFLVRAHLDLGEEEEARGWMEKLVVAFPAHRPQGDAFPPTVEALWDEVAGESGQRDATLDLGALTGTANCRVEVNGEEVEGERLRVASDRMYIVGHQCGDDGTYRARWIAAASGEERRVHAFYAGLEAGALETSLEQIADRRNLDAVVYVGPGSCGDGDSCVGVYRRDLNVEAFQEAEIEDILASQLSALW